MIGRYISGNGKVHEFVHTYQHYFNCALVGTFNVQLDGNPPALRPCIEHDAEVHRRFWLVKLDGQHYAWSVRWDGSKMPLNRLELVSKTPLPDYLKYQPFSVEMLEPLTAEERQRWVEAQRYWFQSFSWGPKRADSALIWQTICTHAPWHNASVLDIGCANGAHCFYASRSGAHVVGFEPDKEAREKGIFINDHIEMQDVRMVDADPGGVFDHIFYFSVHHQWDERYDHLKEKMDELRSRCRSKLFVELIVPDLQRTRSLDWIDTQVGGRILLEYSHKVRKIRRIYEVQGEAQ
jgi:hypothetical protein